MQQVGGDRLMRETRLVPERDNRSLNGSGPLACGLYSGRSATLAPVLIALSSSRETLREVGYGIRQRQSGRDGPGTALPLHVSGRRARNPGVEISRLGCAGAAARKGLHLQPEG